MSDEESGDSGWSSGDGGGGDDGPCSNLFGSCLVMIVGLVLLPCSLYLLGWNEQSFVCQNSRILYADKAVEEVGCSSQGIEGKFVFFSCPLVPSSLETFSMCTFNRQNVMSCATQPPIQFNSVSGRQVVEMMQCKESCKTEKHKNALGQNEKKRVCHYNLEWSEEHINSGQFYTPLNQVNNMGCSGILNAGGNPAAPLNLDMGTSTDYATEVRAGDNSSSFVLNRDLIKQLYPNNVVSLAPFQAAFAAGKQAVIVNNQPWARPLQVTAANTFIQGDYLTTCTTAQLGCVRVKFYMSGSTHPSVMTRVESGGTTVKEVVPGSWGCAKEGWQGIVPDEQDKEGMIQELQDMNRARVWAIRLMGLFLCWVSVWFIFQPISAAAECVGDCLNFIPCGGYIDDFLVGLVDSVLCLISCSLGCSCGLFVIAIVWLYMRPLYGGLMLAGCVLLCCCAGAVRSQSTQRRPLKGKGGFRRGRAPVDPSIARGFLEAARAEYVYGAPRAVENFFDSQGVEPEDQQALASFEDQIRGAYDKHQAISQMQANWGLDMDE